MVVSAVDIKRTFLEMLDPEVVPARLRRRVERFSMALPLFVVYAILDRDLRAEGMPSRNWSVIDCDDLDGLYATVYEESATPITLPIRVRSRQSQLVILGSTRRR